MDVSRCIGRVGLLAVIFGVTSGVVPAIASADSDASPVRDRATRSSSSGAGTAARSAKVPGANSAPTAPAAAATASSGTPSVSTLMVGCGVRRCRQTSRTMGPRVAEIGRSQPLSQNPPLPSRWCRRMTAQSPGFPAGRLTPIRLSRRLRHRKLFCRCRLRTSRPRGWTRPRRLRRHGLSGCCPGQRPPFRPQRLRSPPRPNP